MALKKYTISIDGLLSHESIIFKLICSVSERTKNRTSCYEITSSKPDSDILINDFKNKDNIELQKESGINVWVSDSKVELDNVIARPLIATRVLHTLDKLVENITPGVTTTNESTNTESENNSIEFNISEEEASELAIVHDEI